MIRAIGLAIADLASSRVLSIMLQATAIALFVFLLLGGLLIWLLAGSDPCDLLGLGSCRLDTGSGVLGAIVLTLIIAWFVFPAVAIAVITTFSDRIASVVEERHYPDAARTARKVGIGQGLLLGLKSAARLILFNLLALPFYLLLLITGVGPFILFVIVNGMAFGRDVAELAAARHGDNLSRRTWLRKTRGPQHLIGFVVSALFLVPFANLLAPVIGTAAGIHLFNRSFWSMNLGKGPLAAVKPDSAATRLP